MSSSKLPEYILLSELIKKIKDKEYYCVFAKTLLMTVMPDTPIPKDDQLVKEMFIYFIKDKQLKIYSHDIEVNLEDIDNVYPEQINATTATRDNKINWDSDIFVKVKDLKKLYANKCIVLPNSLFLNKKTASRS